MTKLHGSKYYKRVLLILCILASGWLVVNWFFTYRLERYLNNRLAQNISNATDGFYTFSFEKLSIGFFDGELSIENIELVPDSALYHSWLRIDSLPSTYFKIKVDKIDFKGINLTWKFDYRELAFKSFEIQKPSVDFFKSNHSARHTPRQEKEAVRTKDLYEIVSPFFNIISVEDLNLKTASVSYTVEDSIKPAVYALTNMNFKAHGFLLDKDSRNRGKLLYSDDFEFWVEHPQTILDNQQLVLKADTIRLNTEDSIIQIKGIDLQPPVEHWNQKHQVASEFVSAKLKEIELKGIDFSQDGVHNYITARSFEMDSSSIHYFRVQEKEKYTKHNQREIMKEPLSLYKSISPLFASLSIDNISINDSRLEYTLQKNNVRDVYTLKELDFRAKDFLVDSLSEIRADHRYLYANSFELSANEIKGHLTNKNHNLKVNRIEVSSLGKFLRMHDIEVEPIKKETSKDYMNARIGSVFLENIHITEGIEAQELAIVNANVQYSSRLKKENIKQANPNQGESTVIELISPYLKHLSIDQINLRGAHLEFNDRESKNLFRVENTQLHLSHFHAKANTSLGFAPHFFEFGDFNLNFSDLEAVINNEGYNVRAERGQYSHQKGKLRLENMSLKPSLVLIQNKDYISFQTSLIDLDGASFDNKTKKLSIKILDIQNPTSLLVKQEASDNYEGGYRDNSNDDNRNGHLLPKINSMGIENLRINNASVKYENRVSKDTTFLVVDELKISSLDIANTKIASMGGLIIKNISIKSSKQFEGQSSLLAAENLQFEEKSYNVENIGTKNLSASINRDGTKVKIVTPLFSATDINWHTSNNEAFNLGDVRIRKPTISIHHTKNEKKSDIKTHGLRLNRPRKDMKLRELAIDTALVNINILKEGEISEYKFPPLNLDLSQVGFDTHKQKWSIEDIDLQIKDISYPVSDFYTLNIASINLTKKQEQNRLKIDSIELKSAYPKYQFALKHPTTQDWFNVRVGTVQLLNSDINRYLSTQELYSSHLLVDDVLLENLKNQKVEIEHNKMPLLYEELHKLPIKFAINNTETKNFNVVYEELPKEGDVAAMLTFMDMDGQIKGLTNIVTHSDQYIELNATGRLMGSGDFWATWLMPINPEKDLFKLNAQIKNFNIADLNPLVTSMAPVRVKSGFIKDLTFSTEASSYGATVDMTFLYSDLNITLYKDKQLESKQMFYTYIANRVLKTNNPDKKGKKPRTSNAHIVRDSYHSTFNYFWQILQPPLIESVGIGKGKQSFIGRVANSAKNIKKIFRKEKREGK